MKQTRQGSRALSVASVGTALLGTVAGFFVVRLPLGDPGVLNFLGLPWPAAVAWTVWGVSVAVFGTAVTLTILALRKDEARPAGTRAALILFGGFFVGIVVYFFSVYGDRA